ncbi:phosphosulfolactate synthase [Brevibacillus humidisoli]|uniref:phosphosulfolactate synthase n=1 Tax=Brevibacillus humidisoli TaxID=2895522 RepID=UPI001E374F1A|nr:phosphosulfolactate synthase [Brevibacillus humidisoli]UFJ42926.1 phosphosulfolactate synthase [Brevibacillus humidisoli]
MSGHGASFWPPVWHDPSAERTSKPRQQGLTMVIDKGLGLHSFEDVMNVSADYIDVYKLGFGTSVLYPTSLLQSKIALARMHHVQIMPGGTFFEVACTTESVEHYISIIKSLGFTAIEVSDGSLPISKERRWQAIGLAKEAGLVVYTEFGKKAASFTADLDPLLQTLDEDLRAGADYVIVEARESGNVGVFNCNGETDRSFVRDVQISAGSQASRLIWEAPRKEQQVALLETLGLATNLGNIATNDVLSVETLRRGLRGDTAHRILDERSKATCE